jgi:REP element-mobilizing transposase RayT
MSYIQNLYHIVLRTYKSEQTIKTEHERELYAIILSQTENLKAKIYRIGGMPDHVHILVSLPSTISLAQYVQAIKTFTSKWLRSNPSFPSWRGWGHEYAGFSCGWSDKDRIINYIQHQKEHHTRRSFQEEYRTFLIENGMKIQEAFFLRD